MSRKTKAKRKARRKANRGPTQKKERTTAPVRTIRIGPSTQIGQSSIPVSVTIIAKNAETTLPETIKSLKANFLHACDELLVLDTGSTDKTAKVARKLGATVLERPDLSHDFKPYVEKWLPDWVEHYGKTKLTEGCVLDFAEARQILMDAAKHDIQFWIDADDIFIEEHPGTFRAMINRDVGRYDAIFLPYQYSFDKHDGSLSSILKRERVIDRRVYRWVGRCHETAIPREGAQMKGAAFYQDLKAGIKHLRDHSEDRASDIRNYVIIRRELEEAGNNPDPRSIFYLGNACRGLDLDGDAINYYKELIKLSGSRDDRFAAALYIAIIYQTEKTKRHLDAIDWLQKCQVIKPEDPRAYFEMARAYYHLGRFQEAIHWFNVGKMLPEPSGSLHNYNPLQIHFLPYQIAALAYKELNQPELALQMINYLKERYPNHPDTANIEQVINSWVAETDLIKSVQRVVVNARPKGGEEAQRIGRAIVSHLDAVPDTLEKLHLAKTEPTDGRDGPKVTIYCGDTPTAWGPRSGEIGIGGSEKMVIEIAKRLQARDLCITVYANVPRNQRGIDSKTGANWQHFGAFDKAVPRDTIVYWRAPEMLEMPYKTKKRILWCHDVQSPQRWTKARVALADQVWVQSEYHKSTLGPVLNMLGDKVKVTRNGIDADLFKRYFGIPRNPRKVVYASSPDRGILSAIQIFQAANVPDSELHLFYGFNKLYLTNAQKYEYCHIPDIAREANMYEYMQAVAAACDADDRIVWHGNVGWEELAKEFCSAGVWLYPTRFPEISCMAAMEAQAAGLVVLCSDKAALKETCRGAMVIDPNNPSDAANVLANALEGTHTRTPIHLDACARFNFEDLADQMKTLITT